MSIGQIVDALREALPGQAIEVQTIPMGERVIALPSEWIHPAVQVLVERLDLRHLSAITGTDTGDKVELLYHFWHGHGLTLRTSLAREAPTIASLTDLVPGSAFYEREVSEMLGVAFPGHAGLEPLLLPEDWDSSPPLRQNQPFWVARDRDGVEPKEGDGVP